MIAKWLNEKEMSNVYIDSITYEDIGDEFGHCYMREDGIYYCLTIYINQAIRGMPLMLRGVLWHEFAHAWDYYESGSMGHYNKWIRKWLSKPHYVLAMVVPFLLAIAKMVWADVKKRVG